MRTITIRERTLICEPSRTKTYDKFVSLPNLVEVLRLKLPTEDITARVILGYRLPKLFIDIDPKSLEQGVGHRCDDSHQRPIKGDVVIIINNTIIPRRQGIVKVRPKPIRNLRNIKRSSINSRPSLRPRRGVSLEVLVGEVQDVVVHILRSSRRPDLDVQHLRGVDFQSGIGDLGPYDELREGGHEDCEAEVEGEVEGCPELLAPGWEVGVFHPVEVDEEDDVDCGCCGGDDADDC